MRSSFYDKRDDFNSHITNFPFLSSNIPSSPAYCVFISQLIRYARACSSYECFILRVARLSSKLPGQGYKRKRKRSDSVLWQKPLHPQNNPKKQRDNTKTPPKTLITQLLRTDLGRSAIWHGTFEIVPQEVSWSIWGSHQTLWSLPLPNVKWHSRTWPYTMTPSIDQTLHQFANLLPNWL